MRPFRQVNKYRAKRTRGFASKREAQYADELASQKRCGAIADWLEQVPVRLPGGVKYVVDFMVIDTDGTVRFVEIKGRETEAYKVKLRVLEESRPEIFGRLTVLR